MIDISGWGAVKRSIRFKFTKECTLFGLLTGQHINSDGTATVALFGWSGSPVLNPGYAAGYGDKVREWEFTEDAQAMPAVQEVMRKLDIATGKVKPGAPLPDSADLLFGDIPTGDEHGEEGRPVANKPAGHTTIPAAETAGLRRVAGKKG